jgi:glycosyltransferase involved in cell wall biosynthesis
MLFSIVVLSYNRPKQIKRIFEKIISAAPGDYNLIIKDDCSPRQKEIEQIVYEYAGKVNFNVVFWKNQENLGYDKNLLDAFNVTEADYVFLLSDDDYVDGRYIDKLVDILSLRQFKMYFTPYNCNNLVNRINVCSFNFHRFQEVIYNSILFSGLIFDRKAVNDLPLDRDFLSKCIYTQVYLASLIIYNDGKFGEGPVNLLYLGGDGENFFGKNQSSNGQAYLQNRDAIDSNLKYQSLLINVVKRIAIDTNLEIFNIFKNEYDKRLVAYLLRVRSQGLTVYFNFKKSLEENLNEYSWYVRFSIFVFPLVPGYLAVLIYKFLRSNFRKSG